MEFNPTIIFCESKSNDIVDISEPANPDPAAIFGAAISLWIQANQMEDTDENFCISDIFSGRDGFMWVIMNVTKRFEEWSCNYINFEMIDEPWPYILEEQFGPSCANCISFSLLGKIDNNDFMKIALDMNIPLICPLPDQDFENSIYLV
ncbi:MAG: hypothetical protein SGI98_12320 [Verrucomicrobiota bacterium]|nr:hypothetical protein [Verrucomicrobiota bacterium]